MHVLKTLVAVVGAGPALIASFEVRLSTYLDVLLSAALDLLLGRHVDCKISRFDWVDDVLKCSGNFRGWTARIFRCGRARVKVDPPLARATYFFRPAAVLRSFSFTHSCRPRCPEPSSFSSLLRDDPVEEAMEDGKSIGIIGMGDMGKMYARRLSDAGWK